MGSLISFEATGWQKDCTHQVERLAVTGYINGPCTTKSRTFPTPSRKQTRILAEMSPACPCPVLNGKTTP
ncbi:hypothetical protein [Zoogloea sp.]|uniref:hypothetical protein n=1 Tax=Zoogloea sp. TaxID=49181 RepID=UPI001D8E0A91|nr:hypothetical protein [Zoogloea sp.]MBK6652879.1 hypothetical protein [Zoogloea sp.]